MSYKKVCAGRTLAPSAVAVRQRSAFRASAHPQRSVVFYTIGNEISYRIKNAANQQKWLAAVFSGVQFAID